MFKKKNKDESLQNEVSQNEIIQNDLIQGGKSDAVRAPKKKLPGWMIIPILAVLAFVIWGITKLAPSESGGTALAVVTAEKGNVRQTYNTSGTIESERTKVFYSPVNAPIAKCSAKAGTEVKAGEMLVTFDVTNLERDNEQSKLNELSAKYSNQDAIEQSNRAAASAAQAEAQAAQAESTLRNRISEKQNQVNQLEQAANAASSEALDNAAKAEELQQKLQENLDQQSTQRAEKENADRELANLAPDAEETKKEEVRKRAEEATNALSTLEQEYRTLEQQLGQIGGTDASGIMQELAAAKQELDALNASLTDLQNSKSPSVDTGLTGGQKSNMQVTENLAELTALTTEELLNKGREGIKAEFDGIIANVQAVEGSSAVQGGELFTLVSSKDVYVSLEVPANDFDNLKAGSRAEVKIGKKTYTGKLDSIDRIALPNDKGNPVIKARVHITNPDENVYIGVNAKVSLNVAEAENVLSLPVEVINTAADGDFVYVLQGGVVKKQPVELGVLSGSRAEIISGLEEGAEVVSDTGGNITEGMKASAVKEQ
ncbi:efflux RND transporter periplasmic adaptor subunit [Lachnospiraceae bacterium 42-17]